MANYIKTDWYKGKVIGENELDKIENQLETLSDLMIDERRIGSTLTMVEESSSMPTKLEVKTMNNEAGGITPTPPSFSQSENILFADGYDEIRVSSSIDNANNRQDFFIHRIHSADTLTNFGIEAASTANIGLMSSTDKSHLDTIWDGKLQNNATIVTSNNINSITGLVTTSNFTDQLQNIGIVSTSANGLVPQLDGSTTNFLRADGTWAKSTVYSVNGYTGAVNITPGIIGAATSSHGNHVPATEAPNNTRFLRNDNTWQTITPANIGAAISTPTNLVLWSGTRQLTSANQSDTISNSYDGVKNIAGTFRFAYYLLTDSIVILPYSGPAEGYYRYGSGYGFDVINNSGRTHFSFLRVNDSGQWYLTYYIGSNTSHYLLCVGLIK